MRTHTLTLITAALCTFPLLLQAAEKAPVAKLELRLVAPADGKGKDFPTLDGKTIRLEEKVILTQADVAKAVVTGKDVHVNFTSTAAKNLGKVTAANLGRQLAIVIKGVVQIAPTIMTHIDGGNLAFSMKSPQEAQLLAKQLNRKK